MTRKRYPKADVKGFLKRAASMVFFVILVHWIPEVGAWIRAFSNGETLTISERHHHVLLVIAYIMAGFGTLFELSGMLYATWQNRKLEREEQSHD